MKIGGWLRLWIVLSALWLIPMAILAYDQQPTREKIISNWSYEGIDAVANRVAQIEKYAIQAHEVSADIHEKHPTPSQAIEWLKKIEANPVDEQGKLTSTIAPINEKYERSLDQLSNEQARHFGVFFFVLADSASVIANFRHQHQMGLAGLSPVGYKEIAARHSWSRSQPESQIPYAKFRSMLQRAGSASGYAVA